MLALRTALAVLATAGDAIEAATRSRADAVLLDLAAPALHRQRTEARGAIEAAATALTRAGRAAHVRVSSARSGELAADIEAAITGAVEAIVLSSAEIPQDVRDADVAIRKREMRLGLTPGGIRLIPEVDAAAGLQALPALLEAVDRHGAVLLDCDALLADLGARSQPEALIGHALGSVAVAARAAGLPWLVAAPGSPAGERAALANRAHAAGAAGGVVTTESEVQGLNTLFAPDPAEVATARLIMAEWERVRRAGGLTGVAAGRIADRRSARRARLTIAFAEQIEARERARR